MSADTVMGCGVSAQFGHGEVVRCGQGYYGGPYICPSCKEAALHSETKAPLQGCDRTRIPWAPRSVDMMRGTLIGGVVYPSFVEYVVAHGGRAVVRKIPSGDYVVDLTRGEAHLSTTLPASDISEALSIVDQMFRAVSDEWTVEITP